MLIAPAPARAQASASPYTSAQRHDAVGRITGMIAPDPDGAGPLHHAAVRNTYDGAGRLTKVETGELAAWQSEAVAPAAWANFTIYRTAETQYDAMSRKVRETLRDGVGGVAGTIRSVTQTSYDSLGRPECTAIRMNPAAFASLPASACTPGTAGSDGPDRITRNVYDAAGQRLQLREGVGSADEGTEASWAYNANGQVTTIIDGNGNRAELRYDGHGRQDRWTFPSATRAAAFNDATAASALASAGGVNASDYEGYQYDLNGNRLSLRKRDGSILAYSYDALNRVTLKIVPERTTGAQALTAAQTRDVYYAYDLRNLQISARFDSASGEGVTSAYDGFGRLTSSSADMGGVTRTLTYAHDRNGNRTSIAHPDGNAFNTLYDGANRPRQLLANGATSLASTSYTPYGTPALTLRIGNAVATAQGYDGVLRPTVRVHYFTPGATNAVWSYDFNAASQLNSVARDNDAFAWTGHYTVARAYATNGLNQYTAAGSAVFLYDGDALVAEYDGATDAMLRRHVHNVGADVPMVTYEGAGLGTIRQLLADHQGSIVAHADASGAAVQINRYDEYGIPAATNTGRFQYTGQAWLAELGMYYYKARVYSPTLGRFMQTDPIGYEGGANLYAYVENDPVNATDPDGLAPMASGGCGTRIKDGNNCTGMSGAEYQESLAGGNQDGRGSGPASAMNGSQRKGPLSGRSTPDQRSAAQINQFSRNPRATLTQTARGTTLTVSRTGNSVRGSVSSGRGSLRFSGRFVDVPNRPIIRIEDLRFTGPFGTTISSSPATITIYTHRDGSIHVATDHPMVVRVWPGLINIVNEPSGDRLLNE